VSSPEEILRLEAREGGLPIGRAFFKLILVIRTDPLTLYLTHADNSIKRMVPMVKKYLAEFISPVIRVLSMTPPDLEELNNIELRAFALGSFSVGLLEGPLLGEDARQRFQLHDIVISKILSIASTCRIYYSNKSILSSIEKGVLSVKKKFVELDKDVGMSRGNEYIWNISGGVRGTIVVSIPVKKLTAAFENILVNANAPIVWSSRNQLIKGHTRSAIRFAVKCTEEDKVALCFPASNGIEWMDIFAPGDFLMQLLKMGIKCGKIRESDNPKKLLGIL
jgi:hypothetical protein